MADSQPRIPPSVTQPEAEAGTDPDDKIWSPVRVNQAIQSLSPGGGGGGGWIAAFDIVPTTSGAVGSKVYQTAQNDVLLSCQGDTLDLDVTVHAAGPRVKVNGAFLDLTQISGQSHYSGTISITVAGSGNVTVIQVLPNGANGSTMNTAYTHQVGPTILTCTFTGGYPGIQTELKAGDTYQITGTTDVPANAIDILDFGAFSASLELFVEGSLFTVTGTIADRGTSPQALPARVRARNSALAFGPTFDTDSTGTVDGVNRVNLNNTYPGFVDNGTTFPPTQAAFKGVEAGAQDTAVSSYDTLTYSSPNGDFAIGSPTVYLQLKPITCTNPGNYNDSITNFRIVADRVANDATATFNKVIEVADIAPIITMLQPQARLRSGGNVGTSPQDHVITASSDQNLAGAPDVTANVSGTWQGGGFVGGPKIWTRTLRIVDGDAKGSAAWTLAVVPTNNANTPATITGTQINGGFVFRVMTIAAFAREGSIGTQVSDTTKLECSNLSKGLSGSLNFTYKGTIADLVDFYTITQPTGIANPTGNLWYNCDAANAASNSSGTAQIELEETV